jgi:hypothetical protein
MTDPWDTMIEGDEAEVIAEIRSDMIAYSVHMLSNNTAAAIAIEQKYGLYGLSPQQVSEQLHEMTLPEGGAA